MGFVGVTLSVSQSLDGDLALPGPDPQFRLVVRFEKYVRDPYDGNRSQLAVEEKKSHDSTLAEVLSLDNSRTTTLMSKMSFVPDVDLLSHEHLGPSIMRYAKLEARMGARLMRQTKLKVVATVVYVVGLDEECAGREVMPPETGETVARTPCRHVFHRHCIINWMHRQGTCPLCGYSPWNPHEL